MATVTVNADAGFPPGPHALSVAADIAMLDEAGAVIVTTTLPAFVAGVQASVPIVVTGAPPITLAITSGALPAGMSLVGTSIGGVPSAPGSGSVTLTATNPVGSSTAVVLSWTVSAAAAAPFITSASLPVGALGVAYSYTVTWTGSGTPTWVAQGLPPGLSINASTGAITGTPTADGAQIVTITLATEYGSASVRLSLAINQPAASGAVGGWARFLGK